MDNIIDFSENSRDNSVGKSVADIVRNVIELANNNATETINFDLDYQGLSIHIFKTKKSDNT